MGAAFTRCQEHPEDVDAASSRRRLPRGWPGLASRSRSPCPHLRQRRAGHGGRRADGRPPSWRRYAQVNRHRQGSGTPPCGPASRKSRTAKDPSAPPSAGHREPEPAGEQRRSLACRQRRPPLERAAPLPRSRPPGVRVIATMPPLRAAARPMPTTSGSCSRGRWAAGSAMSSRCHSAAPTIAPFTGAAMRRRGGRPQTSTR